MKRILTPAGALAVIGLVGHIPDAHAALILDTGIPGGSSVTLVSTTQSLAGEFAVTPGETITQVGAYLTPGPGQTGEVVDFAIYSNSGFIGGRNLTAVATGSTLFSGTGWNSANVSWAPSTAGDYWLVVSLGSTPNLDAPEETSASTGTAPALAFAYKTGASFTETNAPPIGLEVTAVPLPAAAWLLLSGLGGLGMFGRKRAA